MSRFRGFLMSVVMLLVAVGLMGCYGTPKTAKYKLNITYVGNGTVSEAGLSYSAGTMVTLHPVPGTNAVFGKWTGPNATEVTVDNKILMNGDKNLVANFDSGPAIVSHKTWGTKFDASCGVELSFPPPSEKLLKVYRRGTYTISTTVQKADAAIQVYNDTDSVLKYGQEYYYWVVPLAADGITELGKGPEYRVIIGADPSWTIPSPKWDTITTGMEGSRYWVDLKWILASVNDITFNNYTVEYRKDGTSNWVSEEVQGNNKRLYFNTFGEKYWFRIKTMGSGSKTSGYSSEEPKVVGGTIPQAPQLRNCSLVSGTTNVLVEWLPVDKDTYGTAISLRGYKVYRKDKSNNDVKTFETFGGASTYTDTIAVKGVNYQYYVTAISDVGIESAASNVKDFSY